MMEEKLTQREIEEGVQELERRLSGLQEYL